MATTRVFYKGKKELTMAQFEALTSLDDAIDYNITDFPNGGITNAQMTAALGYSRLFVDGDVFVCLDNGTYTKGHTYQVKVTNGVKSWEDITPASGGSQDYQIVTEEPTDKSEGKMIYQKSAATTFGKAVINKTAGDGEFYSSPSDFFSKFSEGTATISEIENYEYMLSKSEGFLLGYINMGNLPELTQYITSHNSFNLLYKVNGGEEQTDTLTLDTETGFYVGTKLTVLRTNKLDETITIGVPDDYYTATIQGSEYFPVATTDTIEVTRLNLGGTYVIVEKESSSSFDITNLKIANGSQYNSLKDYLGGSPLYKHELVIPYSFSVTDPTNGTATVNGSVTYHYLSNTGTQITSASEISDNFMLSGGIGKNSANTALIWRFNDVVDVNRDAFTVNFTSNGINFTEIGFKWSMQQPPAPKDTMYYSGPTKFQDVYYGNWGATPDTNPYRTVTFETEPSGELLTWLQANAVPQGGASTTTVLLFDVNVTKAGSSITVEAVNAATTGYITGTVGTITDTVTQLI